MAEDTGRGLKGQKGPVEGEGTRASPRGDGNPRGVTGSCSHSRPDPCSAWTPPGVGALPQLVMKAQPHQETRPAPLQPGTAASPGHPSCGSREWEVGTLVHAGVSMHMLPPGPSPHVGAGAAGMSLHTRFRLVPAHTWALGRRACLCTRAWTPGPEGDGRSSLMLDECPQEGQLPLPAGEELKPQGDSPPASVQVPVRPSAGPHIRAGL